MHFQTDYPTPLDAAYLTFLGRLVGSLSRPVGGMLADKVGGAWVTMINFLLMAGAATTILVAAQQHSLPRYMADFTALFTLSGVDNGCTYKTIPAIFKAKHDSFPEARRLSGALIGIAGAVGALGGVLVNIALRQSFIKTGEASSAYSALCLVCVVVTYVVYLRPGHRLAGV